MCYLVHSDLFVPSYCCSTLEREDVLREVREAKALLASRKARDEAREAARQARAEADAETAKRRQQQQRSNQSTASGNYPQANATRRPSSNVPPASKPAANSNNNQNQSADDEHRPSPGSTRHFTCHYALLGIGKVASDGEIKKAYHRLGMNNIYIFAF